MAVVTKCDGCGKTSGNQEEFKNRGEYVRRQYCRECVELADELTEDLKELRASIRADLRRKTSNLRHKYRQFLQELPDVPDRQTK